MFRSYDHLQVEIYTSEISMTDSHVNFRNKQPVSNVLREEMNTARQ
jgi:hypothetical protein